MSIAVSEFFRIANYAEALLWWILGLAILLISLWKLQPRLILAGVTLIAFGFSDIVETRTGAWWRPWWLLVWKTLCVALMLVLLLLHLRDRRARSP